MHAIFDLATDFGKSWPNVLPSSPGMNEVGPNSTFKAIKTRVLSQTGLNNDSLGVNRPRSVDLDGSQSRLPKTHFLRTFKHPANKGFEPRESARRSERTRGEETDRQTQRQGGEG